MLQVGKIKLRDIKELQEDKVVTPKNALTPLNKRKNLRKSTTTSKKLKDEECVNETVINNAATTTTKTAKKRLLKSALKETPSNQKRIDSYFTSCPKNYDIKFTIEELPTPVVKTKTQQTAKSRRKRNTSTNKKNTKSPGRSKARRKRLFTDSTEPSTENMSDTSYVENHTKHNNIECITIDSDSEEESNLKKEPPSSNDANVMRRDVLEPATSSKATQISSLSFGLRMSKTSCENTKSPGKSSSVSGSVSRRKKKPCPPYKIIENTTFAVDAFQFGYIDNVTHYFLTHFHADHYIGLTKSFSMPLFVSPITARLLRSFIPVQEQFIHELELNEPYEIDNIQITAIDANHCPGSVMFLFKFLDTDKCILHTGDFRACHDMESEPIFWNNHINTIYLDTTYISDKYAFCTQYESIRKAQNLIDKFMEKHCLKRVLYICGSYIIGKEKFWSSLAEENNMKVWTEGNRYKALKAINEERYNRLLVEDPNEANMHILPMGKLTYLELVEYFKLYEDKYDILFAIRPSGWEKDTKPRYGAKINLIGVEYSEHSSYAEMQRFVKFLKPDQVISTVPTSRDLMRTTTVPASWYKYDKLKSSSNYQPSIDTFLGKTPQNKSSIRLPNTNKGGVEYFVSPLKITTPSKSKEINNNSQPNETISIASTKPGEQDNNIEELPKIIQNNTSFTKIMTAPTLAKSITNSSEDFEQTDFLIKTKLSQRKKDFDEQNLNCSLSQIKPTCSKKQLTPKNINVKVNKMNSEELFETPDNKIKKKNKIQIQIKQAEPLNSSEVELNNLLTTTNINLNEHNLEISSTQKRITRSQKTSSKSTSNSAKSKTNQNNEFPKTSSQKKSKSNNSTTSDKTTPLDLELPISQKRAARSKTTSTKSRVSFNSQNNTENEFETKLLKITEQNTIENTINRKSQLKSTITLNDYQENPILKSTTDSSLDRISNDDVHYNFSTINKHKTNGFASNDNCLDEFDEQPTTSNKYNKRPALNYDSTPFKKNKPHFNAQKFLNTILEQNQDIDRFNCSQLAGLVVETVNQQNPDNNKDHIPADLLSDADDDWM